jgi:hypothetical protein
MQRHSLRRANHPEKCFRKETEVERAQRQLRLRCADRPKDSVGCHTVFDAFDRRHRQNRRLWATARLVLRTCEWIRFL